MQNAIAAGLALFPFLLRNSSCTSTGQRGLGVLSKSEVPGNFWVTLHHHRGNFSKEAAAELWAMTPLIIFRGDEGYWLPAGHHMAQENVFAKRQGWENLPGGCHPCPRELGMEQQKESETKTPSGNGFSPDLY